MSHEDEFEGFWRVKRIRARKKIIEEREAKEAKKKLQKKVKICWDVVTFCELLTIAALLFFCYFFWVRREYYFFWPDKVRAVLCLFGIVAVWRLDEFMKRIIGEEFLTPAILGDRQKKAEKKEARRSDKLAALLRDEILRLENEMERQRYRIFSDWKIAHPDNKSTLNTFSVMRVHEILKEGYWSFGNMSSFLYPEMVDQTLQELKIYDFSVENVFEVLEDYEPLLVFDNDNNFSLNESIAKFLIDQISKKKVEDRYFAGIFFFKNQPRW